MPPVDSQATMCKDFVLRRLFATSCFSVESVRTVGSKASVRPVGFQMSLCLQLVLR